jgi:hypothetical protein
MFPICFKFVISCKDYWFEEVHLLPTETLSLLQTTKTNLLVLGIVKFDFDSKSSIGVHILSCSLHFVRSH